MLCVGLEMKLSSMSFLSVRLARSSLLLVWGFGELGKGLRPCKSLLVSVSLRLRFAASSLRGATSL